jgi:pimeloyl-ACP methyl ester carboxylesterase
VIERAVRTSARGIVYSDRGSGPAVVLHHGWCLNRKLWLYQETAFIESHRVGCPDLPGFGDSAALAGPYSVQRYGAETKPAPDSRVGLRYNTGEMMPSLTRDDTHEMFARCQPRKPQV